MNTKNFDAIILDPIDNVGTTIKLLKENSNIICILEILTTCILGMKSGMGSEYILWHSQVMLGYRGISKYTDKN